MWHALIRSSLRGIVLFAASGPLAISSAGQAPILDYLHQMLPTDSEFASVLALGDVDGDGDRDLVLVDLEGPADGHTSGRTKLFLNDGVGVFSDSPSMHMPVDNGSGSLVLGDVDLDGDLDLVGSDFLYLNDGTGIFTDVTATNLPPGYEGYAALGDVNGDGYPDLAVGTLAQNRLYLNDGSGSFKEVTGSHMPVDSDLTASVVLGDVDGDGDLDVVFGNYSSGGQQNRLYRNDGSGVFADVTATQLPVYSDWTTSLALGDLDGDGDPDLVVGNLTNEFYGEDPSNRLYLNDGSGRFNDATATHLPNDWAFTNSIGLCDVDGDGDLDLIEGNEDWGSYGGIHLHLNDGTGVLSDVTATNLPLVPNRARALALGDVDGDEDPDIVLGFALAPAGLLLNDGGGIFSDAGTTHLARTRLGEEANAMVLGDVDGDGDLDLVLGADQGEPTIPGAFLHLNDGTGLFRDATSTHLPVTGAAMRTDDLILDDMDGDGDADLVLGGGATRLYLNDGTGVFSDVTATHMMLAYSDPTSSLARGDVDGDGDLDLVVGRGDWWNELLLNDGSGVFTGVWTFGHPHRPTSALALVDLDGDVDLDLVVGNGRHKQQRPAESAVPERRIGELHGGPVSRGR